MDSAIAGKRDKRCAAFSLAKLVFITCSVGIAKVGNRGEHTCKNGERIESDI